MQEVPLIVRHFVLKFLQTTSKCLAKYLLGVGCSYLENVSTVVGVDQMFVEGPFDVDLFF